MNTKVWLSFACGLSALFFVSCASAPVLSAQQRRAIQVRMFEHASYDNVFRAVKTVLQDDGYIIKNQDLAGGLIIATIQKTDGGGSAFWAAMAGSSNYRTGEGFETSVNLEQIAPQTVETRVVIQRLEQYSQGGVKGDEILEPEIYQSLYRKIQVEVERRKATGRK